MVPRCAIPCVRKRSQEGPAHGYDPPRRTRCGATKGWEVPNGTVHSAQINLYVQSGGDIDSSITSMCLESLEALDKKEIDMEVICNTTGSVYVGRSCFTVVRYTPNRLLQQCQTPYVSPSPLVDSSDLLLDKRGT